MILYTLTNATFTLDIYEDKVVFHPKLWKGIVSKQWDRSLTIPYSQLQRVELNKKLWPAGHQLSFHTAERTIVFSFRSIYPFYERLLIYLERQVIRYYNHPEGFPPSIKTVPDLLEERKKGRSRSRSSNLAA